MKREGGPVPEGWFGRLTASQTARSGVWSLLIRISFAFLTFAGSAILARLLGVSGFGLYSWAFALVTLLSVPSQFGLPVLVTRETARGMAEGDPGIVRGSWSWAGRITLWTSFAIIFLTLAVVALSGSSFSGERFATLAWGLVLIPLMALGNLRGAALRGLRRVVAGQLPEFVLRPGLLVVLVPLMALWLGPLTPSDAMAAHVAAAAFAFLIGAWLLWRWTPASIRTAAPRIDSHGWFRSTLPLAFTQQMQTVNRQAAVILLGFLLLEADVGIYRVAAQVSLLSALGLQAANNVVAPRFARLHARGDMARLQRTATLSARAILLLSLPVTAGFVIAGRPFLTIVFGPEYAPAYWPMVVLLFGQFVNSASGSVGALLNMTGYERDTARGVAISVVSNVVLNLALIPILGVMGAAVATAASLVIWNLLLMRSVRRRLGIRSSAFAPITRRAPVEFPPV